MADPIRAALERLTVLARAELDAGRIPGQPAWERAMADALYALAAAPPAEGGVVGPSDEDLLRLMPERWTAPVHAAAAIQAGALSYARVVWAAAASAHQIQPAPPAEGEVAELMAALRADAKCIEAGRHDLCSNTADQLTRAAELLQQCHPAPVPVSERLPGPEDCDAEGRCWWLKERANPDHDLLMPTWHLQRQGPAGTRFFRFTHWCPFHALPLPAAEAQP